MIRSLTLNGALIPPHSLEHGRDLLRLAEDEAQTIRDQLGDPAYLAIRLDRDGECAFDGWKARAKYAGKKADEAVRLLVAWVAEREQAILEHEFRVVECVVEPTEAERAAEEFWKGV